MVGRKPKPTELKIVGGNAGRRPLPENEPEPQAVVGQPPIPNWLEDNERAAVLWPEFVRELQAMRVLTTADLHALALLCSAYAAYQAHTATIADEGTTYTSVTEKGEITRPHPEVAMASDAYRRAQGMLVEFGMTPSSRTRVKAAKKPEAADPLGEFV